MEEMICNDCGYEWTGEEGCCPECDSLNTNKVLGSRAPKGQEVETK